MLEQPSMSKLVDMVLSVANNAFKPVTYRNCDGVGQEIQISMQKLLCGDNARVVEDEALVAGAHGVDGDKVGRPGTEQGRGGQRQPHH